MKRQLNKKNIIKMSLIIAALCVIYSIWDGYYNKYSFNFFGFIFTKEKTFIKENQRIHLIGMIHIAEQSLYDGIKERYGHYNKDSLITLAEGVSDDAHLITANFSYDDFSKIVNLSSQKDPEIFQNLINADGDTSLISKKEIESLNNLFTILGIATYDYLLLELKQNCEILHRINNNNISREEFSNIIKNQKLKDELNLLNKDPFQPCTTRNLNKFDIVKYKDFKYISNFNLQDDSEIVIKRNQFLIKKMNEQLSNKNLNHILIPWGAEHLPYIENYLKEQGFKEEKSNIYYAYNQFTMFSGLFNLYLVLEKANLIQ